MNRAQKVVLPIVVLIVGGVAAWLLIISRAEPETVVPQVPLPLVRTTPVQIEPLTLTVHSQGTVRPRTESALIAEVAGMVIEVTPDLVPGGFFEQGDLLLRIDPQDYHQALVEAESRVTEAELRLAQEKAEAALARQEWSDLGEGDATPLTLHEPQLATAEAALVAAKQAVEQARRNLERTAVRAPYAGRVREKAADLGQFVNRGSLIASIYSVDYAEVRLPLPDSEAAFLELPLSYRGEDKQKPGPKVTLSAEFAGRRHQWRGRIVRTEGEIDTRSRMIHAVARVSDPYARSADPLRPPLAVGLYVNAEIEGRQVEGVAVLPRAALREGGHVLVVDAEERIRFREIEVLRKTANEVIVSSGLVEGERVVISPLAVVTDGMQVRTVGDGQVS